MDIKKFNFRDLQKNNLEKNQAIDNDMTLADHILSQNFLASQTELKSEAEDPKLLLYSGEEIENLKLSSYEEGRREALLEATKIFEETKSEKQQEIEKIIYNIEDKFNKLSVIDSKKLFEENIEHIKILSVNIAKKIASYGLTQNLSLIIENMIEKYISELKSEKNLTVRINSEFTNIKQELSDKLSNLSKRNEVNFEIICNDNIKLHDIKIEWNNGFIKRDVKQILEQIETLIHRL